MQNTKIIFSGIYDNVIGGKMIKHVDVFKKKFIEWIISMYFSVTYFSRYEI